MWGVLTRPCLLDELVHPFQALGRSLEPGERQSQCGRREQGRGRAQPGPGGGDAMAAPGREHRMQSGNDTGLRGGRRGFLEVATSKLPLSGCTAAPRGSCSGDRPRGKAGACWGSWGSWGSWGRGLGSLQAGSAGSALSPGAIPSQPQRAQFRGSETQPTRWPAGRRPGPSSPSPPPGLTEQSRAGLRAAAAKPRPPPG